MALWLLLELILQNLYIGVPKEISLCLTMSLSWGEQQTAATAKGRALFAPYFSENIRLSLCAKPNTEKQ